jgi:hypothetical protein
MVLADSDQPFDSMDAPMSPTAGIQLEPKGDWSALDNRKLKQDLERRLAPTLMLWRQVAAKDPAASGLWVLKIQVTRDGKVTAIELVEDTLGQPAVTTEVTTRGTTWWLTAPRNGRPTSFEVTVTFTQ